MRLTPCDCPHAGWCPRHQLAKNEALFQLCRRNRDWFEAWETAATENTATEAGPPEMPSLARRAANLGVAFMRHAVDGLRHVTEEEYEARLQICRSCSSCDQEQLICRQPSCGCLLTVKARWASEACPLGKWPEVPSAAEPTPDE